MKSVNVMVQQIAGLVSTKDVSGWESAFITNVVGQTHGGKETQLLTYEQVEVVQRIYDKHFA